MRVEIELYSVKVTAELSDGSDIYEVATVLKGLLQTVGFQQGNIDDVLNDDPEKRMPEFVEDAVGYEEKNEEKNEYKSLFDQLAEKTGLRSISVGISNVAYISNDECFLIAVHKDGYNGIFRLYSDGKIKCIYGEKRILLSWLDWFINGTHEEESDPTMEAC